MCSTGCKSSQINAQWRWKRESGVFFVESQGVGIFVVVVAILIDVVMSLLQCRGFIVWILAARAARSMHGGGGMREFPGLLGLAV